MGTRTNIVLDDQLIMQAMARAGVKTKKAAVEAALRAYVRKPDYSGLLALAGTGVLADDYDPKALFMPPYSAPGQHVAEPVTPYGAKASRKRATPSNNAKAAVKRTAKRAA